MKSQEFSVNLFREAATTQAFSLIIRVGLQPCFIKHSNLFYQFAKGECSNVNIVLFIASDAGVMKM